MDGYGFNTWGMLFTIRQLLTLGTFVREIRAIGKEIEGYPDEWRAAMVAYLACTFSKLTDYSSTICSWHNTAARSSARHLPVSLSPWSGITAR